jgi:hypothetical protein
MLPTNFDFLASENPQLQAAASRLGEWARKHRGYNVIDPEAVARENKDIDPFQLAYALHLLVVKGLFRQVYMIMTPSGVLAEGQYDDPNKIPKRVHNGFEESFDREDGVIVPILEPISK